MRKARKELKLNTEIVNTLSESVKKIEKEHNSLFNTLSEYNALKSIIHKIKKYKKEIEQYNKLEDEEFLTIIKTAENNITQISNIETNNTKFDSLKTSIDNKKQEISDIVIFIKDNTKELDDLYIDIKNLNLLCVECNKFGGVEL